MTLHQRLKKATDAIHIKLEKDLNLLRDDFTFSDYIALLKRFYGFYRPLETRFTFKEERQKTKLLIQNLSSLGVEDLSHIPLYSSFPEHADHSFVMGISYVIEGSTLGGSVLSKHFREKLKLPDESLSFFSGYGVHTVHMWRDFLDRLENFSHCKECLPESAEAGAVFTFRSLQDWLINQENLELK